MSSRRPPKWNQLAGWHCPDPRTLAFPDKRTAGQAFSPGSNQPQSNLSAAAPAFKSNGSSAPAPAKAPLASIFTKADPSKAEFVWHAQYRGCVHFQWGKPKPSTKVSTWSRMKALRVTSE